MAKKSLRSKLTDIKPIDQKIKENTGNRRKDDRLFQITKNDKGEGKCIIRFLPFIRKATEGAEDIIIRDYHGFDNHVDGKKRYMNEDCRGMIGEDCPACTLAWERYNQAVDTYGKEKAKKYLNGTSKSEYYCNVLVVEDIDKPENEGKVFIYRFGPQIQQLITEQSNPSKEEMEEKGLESFNIADVFESRPFRLWLTPPEKKGEYPHWKKSYFIQSKPEDIRDIIPEMIEMAKEKDPSLEWTDDEDEDGMTALECLCYDLDEFRDGQHTLEADELEAIFNKTIGAEGEAPTKGKTIADDDEPEPEEEEEEEVTRDEEPEPEEEEEEEEEEEVEEEKPKKKKKVVKKKVEPEPEEEEEEEPEEKPKKKKVVKKKAAPKKDTGSDDIDDFLKDIMN